MQKVCLSQQLQDYSFSWNIENAASAEELLTQRDSWPKFLTHQTFSCLSESPLVDCSCSRPGIVIPLTLHINQQSGRNFAQLEDYFESQFQARMMLTSPNILALQCSLGFVHLSQDLINKSSCCGSQLCYFTLTQKRTSFSARLQNFSRTDRLLRHRRLCTVGMSKEDNQYSQDAPAHPASWSPLQPSNNRLTVWHPLALQDPTKRSYRQQQSAAQ